MNLRSTSATFVHFEQPPYRMSSGSSTCSLASCRLLCRLPLLASFKAAGAKVDVKLFERVVVRLLPSGCDFRPTIS
jgi:hypothetical protein